MANKKKQIEKANRSLAKAEAMLDQLVSDRCLRTAGLSYELDPRRLRRTNLWRDEKGKDRLKADKVAEAKTLGAMTRVKLAMTLLRSTAQAIESAAAARKAAVTRLTDELASLPRRFSEFETNIKQLQHRLDNENELPENRTNEPIAVTKRPRRQSSTNDRSPRSITMSKQEAAKEVKTLVAKLTKTEDQGEKRKIRMRLRALGHKGGLGKKVVPTTKKTKKTKKVKKGKRAKK